MSKEPNKRTREDPGARRAQILDEAIRIIGERGYHGFAVQELAQRCALSNAGLLYHFKSKEHLLLAVLEEYQRRMEIALRPLLAQLPQKGKKTRALPVPVGMALLRAIVEQSVAQPELMLIDTVLRAESLQISHPGHGFFCEREAMILRLLVDVVEPYCSDPEATARQIYALLQGLELQWLRAGMSFDLIAEWDRAIAKILPT